MHTIVVGVDGSAPSLEALRFAVAEAELRGGEVRAVSVWHVPAVAYEATWTGAPVDVGAYYDLAESALSKTIEQAGGTDLAVTVSPILREGHPAEVLVEIAKGADLLVVGTRGLGGFRGLLLGSVSQHCAQHAPCPVVIIPPKHGDAA
jgi:nucleotide-binding universal stress UspA family protein